ncbi:MAG: mannitol dehydrogenase family protein [Sulfitobacter sp.]
MEDGLPAEQLTPTSASRPKTGIVHLGLGALFRALGCVFVADAMTASGGDWGIVGVSLRSPKVRDALRPQGWAYTSLTMDVPAPVARQIEVLNDVLVAPEDPTAVLDAMADPAVKIVSLTVTEKGYCHTPATGLLNTEHPDILHDLAHALPRSAIGYLVRALQRRRDAGHAPFTVLTCDNLPKNGKLLRTIVLDFARRLEPDLADWIAEQGRFPCSMVDRITPATTEADIRTVTELTGLFDAAPVIHEPFMQWAIEDDFVGGERPDLEVVGVEMVTNVLRHETMKLRMLNGTHSALAYTGYLAGHKTISDTICDPVFSRYTQDLWSEIIPSVDAPDGVDLSSYADALHARYRNPEIHHLTRQIAMDGSQKLPQRLLGTLRSNLNVGRPTAALCLAIAAWMRYVCGIDEVGQPIEVLDPRLEDIRALTAGLQTPTEIVTALLSMESVFPSDLAPLLRAPVIAAAETLWALGAREAIKTLQDDE